MPRIGFVDKKYALVMLTIVFSEQKNNFRNKMIDSLYVSLEILVWTPLEKQLDPLGPIAS